MSLHYNNSYRKVGMLPAYGISTPIFLRLLSHQPMRAIRHLTPNSLTSLHYLCLHFVAVTLGAVS